MEKDSKRLDGIGYLQVLSNPLLPTAYLAPISYYAILLQKENCKIEYHEHFIKQSIRNRCEIYGANGKLRLTIPKQRQGSSKTKINNIKISHKERWKQEHWNAIVSSYNSSPFFEYYKDRIKPLFEEEEVYLMNFNNKLQKEILEILEIEPKHTATTKYHHVGSFTDLRNYKFNNQNARRYDQVFMEKHGFISNLSILDLIFNLGNKSRDYLKNLNVNI